MTETLRNVTLAGASKHEHLKVSRPFGDRSANCPCQLDLFEWAAALPTARIYDWGEPFAAKLMCRIHEYDDAWPKPRYDAPVAVLPIRRRA
ncbi:hypothetical protein [Mesorhizobium sp. AA23]|uniref:hypothetical protein n=1 Tax=Mesorhizobium sp. AA23 TaxID=1854058 RepID=UPI0012E9D3D8|nr:hypothetical protein [Mesorhizobium sp. AA23]